MYVSKKCLITKNLKIDIYWLCSHENLTGSNNETYDSTTNLKAKDLRIGIQWKIDIVPIRISLNKQWDIWLNNKPKK